MTPFIVIYWRRNIVNGVNGVGYVGGLSRNVQIERKLYYYGALLGIVRDAIGPNRVFNKIGFRNLMLSQHGSFAFGLVEICDDASMRHMYRVMMQFSTLQLIQLFIEVDTYVISHNSHMGQCLVKLNLKLEAIVICCYQLVHL